jgi:hypothetical protein
MGTKRWTGGIYCFSMHFQFLVFIDYYLGCLFQEICLTVFIPLEGTTNWIGCGSKYTQYDGLDWIGLD